MSDQTRPGGSTERMSRAAYVLGVLSFVPVLGIGYGLVSAGWALLRRKRGWGVVLALSLCGMAVTPLAYHVLYRQMTQPDTKMAEMQQGLVRSMLGADLQAVEFYHLATGRYPDGLPAINRQFPGMMPVNAIDLSGPPSIAPRPFLYERVGDTGYILRGLGADGVAFTGDDLLPDLTGIPLARIGLKSERGSM